MRSAVADTSSVDGGAGEGLTGGGAVIMQMPFD
jgi:hypothetical protein